MPRKSRKTPDVLDQSIAAARQELDTLQAGAKEMLERQAAAQAAIPVEDQPSGVTVGTSWDFIKSDNLNASTYLQAHGVEERKDVEYRFVNTDRRVVDRKLHKGWSPVAGGKVRHGDLMVCQRDKKLCEEERRQVAEVARLRENPMQSFETDASREGVATVDR